MEKHSLLTHESIAAWVAENNPGGIDKLRLALHQGSIRGEQALSCMKFLRTHDALREAAEKAVRDALYLREVRIAKTAARWSFMACVVSMIALAVSLKDYWPAWAR